MTERALLGARTEHMDQGIGQSAKSGQGVGVEVRRVVHLL